MGGLGSGNWSRWGTKSTVESCHRLDVRTLQKRGVLIPGNILSWEWWQGDKRVSDIRVHVGTNRVMLIYRSRRNGGEWQEVNESIPLEWTSCHYGGQRPWFRCPGSVNGRYCGRRCAILYDRGPYFLCRTCYDLVYQTQRENFGDRAWHKAQSLRRRLGGSASLQDPLPKRPKGMHRKTYRRLRKEAHRAKLIHDEAVDEQMITMGMRIQKWHPERLSSVGDSAT